MWLALASLAALVQDPATSPTPPADPLHRLVTVEIGPNDPVLEGHGPSKRMEYVADFSGRLYVWALSKDVDPLVRIESDTGEFIGGDDDSGGGTAAWIELEVEPTQRIWIRVASAEAQKAGGIELHIISAAESDTTRAAAAQSRRRLDEITAAPAPGDGPTPSELVERAITDLLATPGVESSALIADALSSLGLQAAGLGVVQAALAARRAENAQRERTLPPEHPALQRSRGNFAWSLESVGELAAARVLEQQALDVLERTVARDDADLLIARYNLAETIRKLGDMQTARRMHEENLAACERDLPPTHAALQRARMGLAVVLIDLGDFGRAKDLMEGVVKVYSRTLPEGDVGLINALQVVEGAYEGLGDSTAARAAAERALELAQRYLPVDHPEVRESHQALGLVLFRSGELRPALQEFRLELESAERSLPAGSSSIQSAQSHVAVALKYLGDLDGARELEERVLEAQTRIFPPDHPRLQYARGNLAQTIKDQGDAEGARILEEQVLESFSRTLPEDHPDMQLARQNLAATLCLLGRAEEGRALFKKVLEVRARALPDDDPDLQAARGNLASALQILGANDEARALYETMLESYENTRPDDHPDVLEAHEALATALAELGQLESAREHEQRVVDVYSRTLGDEHPDSLRALRHLAWILARSGERNEVGSLLRRIQVASQRAMSAAAAKFSPREAEMVARREAHSLSAVLSLSSGWGCFEPFDDHRPGCFSMTEAARGIGLTSQRILLRASREPELARLRENARAASETLARLSSGRVRDDWVAALRSKEQAQRSLLEAAESVDSAGLAPALVEVESIRARLEPDAALVGYWRYERATCSSDSPPRKLTQNALLAFVLRRDTGLSRIELGSLSEIENRVSAWRGALDPTAGRGIGAVSSGSAPSLDALGERVRAALFDPLANALGDAARVVIAADDVVHLVPIDTLPSGEAVVGDRWRIEMRNTLWEVFTSTPPTNGAATFVGMGGIDYDEVDAGSESSVVEASLGTRLPRSLDRAAGATARFAALSGTALEIDDIAVCARAALGAAPKILKGAEASRRALALEAPRARFLHLATHGWFVDDGERNVEHEASLDPQLGLGAPMSYSERATLLSPMVFCGLALAGANVGGDSLSDRVGIITAEELSTFDLSNCELAVLSACDTNVGIRRAGQGVASLQKALHMAGARSVITSLWKVPDEATKDLMLDFYRRLWIEKKPKWQALWEAKMKLRNAKDEQGRPIYSTRDWAAWVLTGAPD